MSIFTNSFQIIGPFVVYVKMTYFRGVRWGLKIEVGDKRNVEDISGKEDLGVQKSQCDTKLGVSPELRKHV